MRRRIKKWKKLGRESEKMGQKRKTSIEECRTKMIKRKKIRTERRRRRRRKRRHKRWRKQSK